MKIRAVSFQPHPQYHRHAGMPLGGGPLQKRAQKQAKNDFGTSRLKPPDFDGSKFGWTKADPPDIRRYQFDIGPEQTSQRGPLRPKKDYIRMTTTELLSDSDEAPRFVMYTVSDPKLVEKLKDPAQLRHFMYYVTKYATDTKLSLFRHQFQLPHVNNKDVNYAYDYNPFWSGGHRVHSDSLKNLTTEVQPLLCLAYGVRQNFDGGDVILADMRQLRRDYPLLKKLRPDNGMIKDYEISLPLGKAPYKHDSKGTLNGQIVIMLLNNMPFDGVMHHSSDTVAHTRVEYKPHIEKLSTAYPCTDMRLTPEKAFSPEMHGFLPTIFNKFDEDSPVRELHRLIVSVPDPKRMERMNEYREFFHLTDKDWY